MPYAIKITPQFFAGSLDAPTPDWLAQGEVNEMIKQTADKNYPRTDRHPWDYDFGPAYFATQQEAEIAMRNLQPPAHQEYFLSYGEYARPVWEIRRVRAPVERQ